MTPDNNARNVWQSAQGTAALPPLATLQSRVGRMRRRIAARNAIEYGAGVLVIGLFGTMLVLLPFWPFQLGAALVILGMLYVLWQLHRRAGALPAEDHHGALPLLDFQRRELVRQHNALDSIFWWYLGPLLPGALVITIAPLLTVPVAQWRWPPVDAWIAFGVVTGIFTGVYLANKFAARALRRQIAAIDALRGE